MAYITERELGNYSGQDAEASVNALPAFRPTPTTQATATKPAAESASTLDVFTAAFRQNNLATAAYDLVANPYEGSREFDKNFSPRRKALEDGLAEYADNFTSVRNAAEYEHVKGRVQQQKQARQVIENAGGMGIGAAFTAAILDPVGMALMTVPVLGEARIAQITSTAARYAARAASIGGTGVAIGATQTGALQAANPVAEADTVQELYALDGTGTSVAVGAGLVLSLFGTTGRAASKVSKAEVQRAVDALLIDPNGALIPSTATAAQRAAGTAVNDSASKLYENAGTKAVGMLADDVSRGLLDGIGMKLAKSPFDSFRKWGQQIAPDIMQRQGTKVGVASPLLNARLMSMMEGGSDIHSFNRILIETKKSLDGLKALTPAEQQEIFNEFRAIGINVKSIDDITPASVQAYASELVGHAVATGRKHVVNEIEAAAQKLRAVYAKDWKRIVAQGLDNGVPTSMPVYFTRVFNKPAIMENQLRFLGAITPHFEQSLLAGGLSQADAAAQAATVAASVLNKITGAGVSGTGADMFRAVTESGPMGKLVARTLDVPYEALAPYLEHDAARVMNIYKRSVEPQLALKEVFGHTSFDDFNANVMLPERDRVKNNLIDSAKTAQGAELTTINAQLNGFDDAWSANEAQMKQLFEGLLGRTKMMENAGTAFATGTRVVRKSIGMAMLSGQVISSLVDIPRQIGTHGITPVMGAWANYLSSSAFRSMSRESAERVGVALELTQHKLSQVGQEAFGGYEREVIGHARGRIEGTVDYASEKFQWLNGAMIWNDTLRTTTAALAEDRLLRAADKGWSKLNRMDREWMLVLGIDEAQLAGIKAASQGSTQTTRRFMHTELEHWTDLDSARAFKLAVLKDAHEVPSIS